MHADLLAWILTYALHSTLLLGAACIAVKAWRRMPVALQESLWRTALLGGVLTASAQVAIGWEPWSGRVAVPPIEAAVPAEPLPGEVTLQPADPSDAHALAVRGDEALTLHPVAPRTEEPAASVNPLPWLIGLWLVGLAGLLLRALGARRGLRTQLATRRPVTDGALRTRLDALQGAAGHRRCIHLAQTDRVGSPVALGIVRAEIVVPARAATELSAAQQEVMLAHELAHHVRRDPLLLVLVRVVSTVLFFQPLNHVARRHLRETSELLCDAWAAERTGRSRELAECLTTVAGWMLRTRGALAVLAMAAEGSMLERRVERLLDGSATAPKRRALARLWAALPLAAVAVCAPVIATGAVPVAAAASFDTQPSERPIEMAPARDAPRALALLDEEIAGLEAEVATLLDLLRRVPNPPEALRRGAARLEARLTALKERRVALVRDAKELKR